MRNVYGKKSKPALLPDFFVNSPEPRRSPRLRKVLEERSANIQQLEDTATPPLSPSFLKGTRRAPIDLAECCPSIPNFDKEPVKKPAGSKRKKNDNTTTKDEGKNGTRDETESLAKALEQLDITGVSPQLEISEDSTATTDSRSTTTSTVYEPAQSVQQHPVKLKPELQAYVSPLLACRSVSKTVESFAGWVGAREGLLSFAKIGEGSYGQVFRATDGAGETVIIKLMPLNAAKGRRWQSFTSVPAAATELQLLARMQKVPGYVEFRGACVLQGAVPELFVRMWEEYRDAGRTVESRDPRAKGAYPSTQLWLMLEMSDAGSNLEPGRYLPPELRTSEGEKFIRRGQYVTVSRLWDIFWQVVFAVAKAETYCRFEHRDLHLGNICVRDTIETSETTKKESAQPKKQQRGLFTSKKKTKQPFSITSTGLVVTIIDYTLSRADTAATAAVGLSSSVSSPASAVAFDFQADEVLLSGEGDLQYDMYRWMDEIIGDRGCRTYDPRTNVIWFYHLLAKLLDMMIPLADDDALLLLLPPPTQAGTPLSREAKLAQREAKLHVLREVKDMTDPDSIETWVANSATDLLQHAFAQDWILTEGL